MKQTLFLLLEVGDFLRSLRLLGDLSLSLTVGVEVGNTFLKVK